MADEYIPDRLMPYIDQDATGTWAAADPRYLLYLFNLRVDWFEHRSDGKLLVGFEGLREVDYGPDQIDLLKVYKLELVSAK